MKKNKIVKLLKLYYGKIELNDEDNSENLKRKLYSTIPPDFTAKNFSFLNKYKVEFSYGLGIFGLLLISYFISVSFDSASFKPTKIVKIEQSDLITDSFIPTKVVEIELSDLKISQIKIE
jgi:hypothetical protein